MIQPVRGILLDIEGTTSSIRFVYDIMFPYARDNFESFLNQHFEKNEVQSCLPILANDLGFGSVDLMFDQNSCVSVSEKAQFVFGQLIQLMDDDVKATGLKKLQGLVWENGFRSGEMVADLFDDVAPAIRQWKESGFDVRIYSSGSVQAQQLFFGHSVAGDLLPMFSGHYDTTVGSKRDAASYQSIAQTWLPAQEVIFISDVVEELEAAADAGMQTALSIRPGNHPVDDSVIAKYVSITSFAQLELSLATA